MHLTSTKLPKVFLKMINKAMEHQRKPCTILIKRRVSGEPGLPASLAHGELAFNEVNNTLYINSNNPSLSSTNDPGTF